MPKPGRLETLTPNQLALRSAVCTVVLGGYILLLWPLVPIIRRATPFVLIRMVGVIPICFLIYVATRYTERIRKGIKSGLWSYDQLDPLKSLINSPVSRVLQVLFLILWIVSDFIMLDAVFTGRRSYAQVLGMIPFFLVTMISNIQSATRSQEPPSGGLQLSLRDSKPLESQQWGER